MSQNMDRTLIIQNSIPTRYDPQVTVKPCEPSRVPDLPLDILYEIAKALPQPKQVFNLAMANKSTWAYLQPALYECEVTLETRLAHKYGGKSSISLGATYGLYMEDDTASEGAGWYAVYEASDSGGASDNGSASDSGRGDEDEDQDYGGSAVESGTSGKCAEQDRRISLDHRAFEAPLPESENPLHINGALTALHWAAKQGASALPVAERAIRSALVHQPSYIDGLGLQTRLIHDHEGSEEPRVITGDIPPPLFLAVANGNFEVFRALLDAGCDVNLLQGQPVCGDLYDWDIKTIPLMSFKIHKEFEQHGSDVCICEFHEGINCQTAGHVAVRYEQPEMLDALVQSGLTVIQSSPESLHLAEFAMEKGSLAALRVLLDHDPNLARSHLRQGTLLHMVSSIKHPRSDVRGIISFLLERGAVLDAGANTRVDEDDLSPTTALQDALDVALEADLYDTQFRIAIHAAEVLISMGADWNRHAVPSWAFVYEGFARNTAEADTLDLGHILLVSLKEAVFIKWYKMRPLHLARLNLSRLEGLAEHAKIRTAWGRVFKTIIEMASKSLTDGSGQDRAFVEKAFSSAFAYLIKLWSMGEESDGECCPLAAEEAGKLLLSTGITPSDADLEKWKALSADNTQG